MKRRPSFTGEFSEAAIDIEAAARGIEPYVHKLLDLAEWFDDRPGQRIPSHLEMTNDEVYGVHQAGARAFRRHARFYPSLADEWIDATLQQFNMTTIRGLRSVMVEKHALLQRCASILRTKAMPPPLSSAKRVMRDDASFRQAFRSKVLESSGDEFQRFFSKVMVYADWRFQSIAPWGSWGDGGNDGWIPEDGHYFQVYGAKPTTARVDSETAALKKAIEDFAKVPETWKDVRRYSFVMNDRFYGTPAPVANALQSLSHECQVEARAFSMNDLMERFMSLDAGKQQDILGGAIPTSSATSYSQTGGVNFAASTVHVHGDVVGGNQSTSPGERTPRELQLGVFKETKAFMKAILASPSDFESGGEQHLRFGEALQEAEFLFGPQERKYLVDVHDAAMKLWGSRQRMSRNPGDVAAIEENGSAFQRLSELWEQSNDVFRAALSLVTSVEAQATAEQELRRKFEAILQKFKGHCYAPPFGSPAYWDAEAMADKGWFDRLPSSMGYVRRGAYNPKAF